MDESDDCSSLETSTAQSFHPFTDVDDRGRDDFRRDRLLCVLLHFDFSQLSSKRKNGSKPHPCQKGLEPERFRRNSWRSDPLRKPENSLCRFRQEGVL